MRRTVVCAFVAVLVVLSLAPASASNFGSTSAGPAGCTNWTAPPCSSISLSPSATVRWRAIDFNGNVLSSLRWSDGNVYDPTDMTFVETTTNVDLYLYDSNWGDNGVIAWNLCPSYATRVGAHPTQACSGREIHYNDYFWYVWAPGGVVDWNVLGMITTHEFGHSVGLRHRTTDPGAMCDPLGYCGVVPWLTAHDVGHINGTY